MSLEVGSICSGNNLLTVFTPARGSELLFARVVLINNLELLMNMRIVIP